MKYVIDIDPNDLDKITEMMRADAIIWEDVGEDQPESIYRRVYESLQDAHRMD